MICYTLNKIDHNNSPGLAEVVPWMLKEVQLCMSKNNKKVNKKSMLRPTCISQAKGVFQIIYYVFRIQKEKHSVMIGFIQALIHISK